MNIGRTQQFYYSQWDCMNNERIEALFDDRSEFTRFCAAVSVAGQ